MTDTVVRPMEYLDTEALAQGEREQGWSGSEEKLQSRWADLQAGKAVGLHSGYGNAQRMYVSRGYMPDGSGVWYGEAVCPAYGACRNDDDLVLYFSKPLPSAGP